MSTKIITAVLVLLYYVVTLYKCRGLKFDVRALVLGGLTCALTLLLNCISVPFPTGGSITLGAMLPLMILAICYDTRLAFVAGWVTGILAMLLMERWQPVHATQVLIEHLICFSALGYAGIFGRKRSRIVLGGLLAGGLRLLAHILSGVVFYGAYAWENWNVWAYSFVVNAAQFMPELIVTIVILFLLPLSRLAEQMKKE